MTKLYKLESDYIKQNYPIVYKVFTAPLSPVPTQTRQSGYEAFKLAGERLKTRQNLSTV